MKQFHCNFKHYALVLLHTLHSEIPIQEDLTNGKCKFEGIGLGS